MAKPTPYPVNSLKLKKILLEQMNNNKQSRSNVGGQHSSQGGQSSRSSSSGGSSHSESNYSRIVNKVERIKIEDENNGNNTSRTASVTPTNNEPVTPTAITDEDKHNGNNVNKSGESETNNARFV